MNTYYKGALVQVDFQFYDASDVLVDPATVVFVWKIGRNGPETTYTYGTNGELVRTAAGTYYVRISADTTGVYYTRQTGSGNGQAAQERAFEVISDF